MVDTKRYLDALQFAVKAHSSQTRKGSGIPYITHPVGVSAILAQYGYEEDVIVAALLHDVLEDTSVTLAQLTAEFGKHVSALVSAVTEEKHENGKPRPWEVRKNEQVQHLHSSDLDVVALKTADAVHNAQSISRDLRTEGERVWSRFKRGKEDQLRYYCAMADVAKHRLGDIPLVAELGMAIKSLDLTKASLD